MDATDAAALEVGAPPPATGDDADAAADGALVVGATAAVTCGGVVGGVCGFDAAVAVGAGDPPHAASRPLAAAALAAASNLRRVQIAIALTPFTSAMSDERRAMSNEWS